MFAKDKHKHKQSQSAAPCWLYLSNLFIHSQFSQPLILIRYSTAIQLNLSQRKQNTHCAMLK